ncbi:MAG: purine-nucleoside phosphorylase [Deltaproteobacteria bacterium]|mgnify:CR=1 FL=1|nr:purine-nucleoside phosphorylase [Deltaproteobacteria bacterium]MBW1930211.1 purine-nucleoside phosphorylase [Deltaproteobacteria bacterium]MBW2024274.1 purine-nucleoside phosphorylase [Deltaproteobacteria bacterium]MBW2126261.1 purine-nucleoside phosphorylase [Deltaproteobacteria bacterium]RLB19897.1 MAG: purine-nucleoside phosphorylase [Deltaproteobacteria bacterium]
MMQEIQQAREFLASRFKKAPSVGLIAGTGLGAITERVSIDVRIPYEEIPNFPTSTTEGHKGTLAFGTIGQTTIVALEGRFHLYEGYVAQDIAFPVRVMALLGVRHLIICSAAGGLNPRFHSGDLMVVLDHINLTGTNPLIGPNLDEFGPRFPDMTQTYDPQMIKIVKQEALRQGISLKEGVYVGIPGPSLETPAETRFLRMIGADAVGMSTVPEVIAAVHCGIKVMAIAVITNVNLPDCMAKTDIKDVIAAAEKASPTLALLCESVIKRIKKRRA